MDKTIEISIDLPIAKRMLRLAGFNTTGKTDDEIFDMVLSIIVSYGATYKIKDKKED